MAREDVGLFIRAVFERDRRAHLATLRKALVEELDELGAVLLRLNYQKEDDQG